MYKSSSAPSDNTVQWHYLDTKHLDFRCSTPGVLIKEIQYMYIYIQASRDVLEGARLELLHADEQSCYMKITNNRTMLNVCTVDDWDW